MCIRDRTNGANTATRHVSGQPLLAIDDLEVHFTLGGGFLSRKRATLKAVDGVSFTIGKGETLGLVGESGCGKTTTGHSIMRTVEPTGGSIEYFREDGSTVNLTTLGNRELKPYRREMRMVFQDPFSSLNPRMTVMQAVGEPLKMFKVASGKQREQRIAELLSQVGLRPEYMRRYPHAFSGGERQCPRDTDALALNPRLIVLDEAVSALD